MQLAKTPISTPVLQSPRVETQRPIPRELQREVTPPTVDPPVAQQVAVAEAPNAFAVPTPKPGPHPLVEPTPVIISMSTVTSSTEVLVSNNGSDAPLSAVHEVKTVEITVERSSTPEQTASDSEDTTTRNVDYIVDGRPTADNNEMTASMIQRRIITEQEAKSALAERRRLVREEAERQAELERQRIEAEEAAELKRQEEEEERQRLLEEETLRLVEEQKKREEERLQQAIEVCMTDGRRRSQTKHQSF